MMSRYVAMRGWLLVGLILAAPRASAEWKVPGDAMLTRWGKQVTPDNAWQEYPRPQFRREQNWQNLNGLWDYAVVTGTKQPQSFDGQILVPFAIEAPLSGVGRLLEPNETLWYRRTIEHETPRGHRTRLHFEAVDYDCTVFIDGVEVGRHIGSSDPFALDITDALKSAKSRAGGNELLVRVIAGVYTQTTDVEGEVNGLMTYDREVQKMSAEELAELHEAAGF
jgi:hypothetical protein